MKKLTSATGKASVFLALSVAVSYLLSMTNPAINNMEMGAILNFFLPGLTGLLTFVILIVTVLLIKKPLRVLLVVLSFINIITGIYLHYFYKG